MPKTTLQLSDEQAKRLRAVAAREHRSMHGQMLTYIEQGLTGQWEALRAWLAAEQAAASVTAAKAAADAHALVGTPDWAAAARADDQANARNLALGEVVRKMGELERDE